MGRTAGPGAGSGAAIAYVQPILDLRSGQVTQYELLVRLAELSGLVEPSVFLPVAERMGLIRQIDLWAFRQALSWAARRGLRMHVNLSGKTVADEEAIRAMVQALDASKVRPAQLVLEIT